MFRTIPRAVSVVGLIALVSLAAPLAASDTDWTRWGGPDGNFMLASGKLSATWPEDGPRELWRVPFGEHGHSTLLVEGDRVYAFVRRGDQDVLAALDAASGKIVWESAYDSPLPEGYNNQFGPGPHATPLIVGDRIFTASSTHVVKAFDKTTGEEIWTLPMKEQLGVRQMGRGYGASPVQWKDTIIVNGGAVEEGREPAGLLALDQATGEVRWQALDAGGYSSPVIAEIDGTPQVLAALGALRAGVDPDSGGVLWRIDLPETAGTTFATQLMADDNLVFGSSAYADGSRILEVRRDGDAWTAEVLWYSRKLRLMHGTAVRAGNLMLASSGDFGPAFLTAIDLESGDLAFRQRGFAKANIVKVGDQFLVLDEDGKLGLLALTPEGLEVLAEAEGVLDGVTWSAPTVVGDRVYLRSRTEIVALDLSPEGS